MENRILFTGSSGFIGKNLSRFWKQKDIIPISFSSTDINDIQMLPGDVIVHLAGIAHQNKGTDPQLYYNINYKKTVDFAKLAKQKGAGHFIYVSSTKVYGDLPEGLYNEESECAPADDYGKSKFMAEKELQQLQDQQFIVSILRPPLVYGAGVKGNMLRLLDLCASGKPLPFKGVKNERSIVYVGNLLAMLDVIIKKRAGGIFIPVDDAPLSTFDMLKLMKQKFGSGNKEIKVPAFLIKLLKIIKPGMANKLFGSLIYDNTKSKQLLNFQNPYSTDEGFDDMVKWYQTEKRN